jgi:hypothetical protein
MHLVSGDSLLPLEILNDLESAQPVLAKGGLTYAAGRTILFGSVKLAES